MDEDASILHKVNENRRRAGRGTSRRQQETRTSTTVMQEDDDHDCRKLPNYSATGSPFSTSQATYNRPDIGQIPRVSHALAPVSAHSHVRPCFLWILPLYLRYSNRATASALGRPWAVTRRSVHCHFVETLAKPSVLHSVLPAHEM